MKKLSDMTFAEGLFYLRKKSKEYGARSRLAAATGMSTWDITSFEQGKSLPTKKQLDAICRALGSPELREIGFAEVEYKRTHPDVKICFADDTTCWKCGKKMCSVYGLINGYPLSPNDFSEPMIEISRKKGVILEERKSGVTGETNLANVCPHCGAFIGEFYLHDLWYGETEVIQVEDVSDFIADDEDEV